MTLARKGTRQLLLDDVHYRWATAPNDEPGVGIVVELAVLPASRLVSWIDHGVTIGPGLVRRAIRDAIAAGWRPSERGPDFIRRVPELSATCTSVERPPEMFWPNRETTDGATNPSCARPAIE